MTRLQALASAIAGYDGKSVPLTLAADTPWYYGVNFEAWTKDQRIEHLVGYVGAHWENMGFDGPSELSQEDLIRVDEWLMDDFDTDNPWFDRVKAFMALD